MTYTYQEHSAGSEGSRPGRGDGARVTGFNILGDCGKCPILAQPWFIYAVKPLLASF